MTVMNVRRLIPATAVAGAVALGLWPLSACSSAPSAADGSSDGKLDVVASFYPMQYLAEQIGGDHVSVTTLTEPGSRAARPGDQRRSRPPSSSEADVDPLPQGPPARRRRGRRRSPARSTKVDAATLTDAGGPRHRGGTSHGHERRRGRTRHDDGGRPALDPHVWLDPVKYAEVAKGVGAALEKADPDHAADYKKNTDALVAQARRPEHRRSRTA